MTAALVTGLLRNPNLTKKLSGNLLSLLEDGILSSVVLSSWESQRSNFGWLGNLRHHPNFIAVTEKEPVEPGPGHIWSQSLSLANGLAAIPREEMVIKLRTDVDISLRALSLLSSESNWCGVVAHRTKGWGNPEDFLKISECAEVAEGSAAFCSGKTWVPWVDITKPLYIADEMYVGIASRLAELVVYDSQIPNGIRVDTCPSHVKRFLRPAVKFWAGFELYARYFGESHHGLAVFADLQSRRMRSYPYPLFLAQYYKFLLLNFEVGSSSLLAVFHNEDLVFRRWLPPPARSVPREYCLCSYSTDYSWGLDRTYIYDLEWLKNYCHPSGEVFHSEGCLMAAQLSSDESLPSGDLEREVAAAAFNESDWLGSAEAPPAAKPKRPRSRTAGSLLWFCRKTVFRFGAGKNLARALKQLFSR